MQDKKELIKNNPSIAMLAPAFILDFKYPAIIGMLKKLGFDMVTEVTYGAQLVNAAYAKYITENPEQELYIASPCPTVVSFINAQYPDLSKYLLPVVSPMAAMSRFLRSAFPEHKIVFISPCLAKRIIEAPKYPESIDDVVTLQELRNMFEEEGIKEEDFVENYLFDSVVTDDTRMFPVSGGLADTAHLETIFKKEEILITDGVANLKKAFDDFRAGSSQYRFMDILNCDGGCIGGPAINNKSLNLDTKRKVVKEYTETVAGHEKEKHDTSLSDSGEVNMKWGY